MKSKAIYYVNMIVMSYHMEWGRIVRFKKNWKINEKCIKWNEKLKILAEHSSVNISPLLCTPKRSLRRAHTKLWWRNRWPLLIKKENIGKLWVSVPSEGSQPSVRPKRETLGSEVRTDWAYLDMRNSSCSIHIDPSSMVEVSKYEERKVWEYHAMMQGRESRQKNRKKIGTKSPKYGVVDYIKWWKTI